MTFVLLMFGLGALLAAGAAAVGAPVWAQLVAFGIGSGLSLLLLRPVLTKHRLGKAGAIAVGLEAIEGSDAMVLKTVTADTGMIKIGGEIWTARAYDATQVIEAGEHVQVMKIDGATALVWRN
ncbi:NfeD family protein [Longispora urticae]